MSNVAEETDDGQSIVSESVGSEAPEKSSIFFSLAKRMLFPTLSLIFVGLYVENTVGRIKLDNLYYPLFIIVCLSILLVSVYISEILDIYRDADQYSATVAEDLAATYAEWKLSIWVVGISVLYLYLINLIGFFPSSFIVMATIMRVGGVRRWRTVGLVSVGVLVFVYIMFLMVLGIRPPTGPLNVF